jgi:magnesium transporter
MQTLHITRDAVTTLTEVPTALPAEGFIWMDALIAEPAEPWRALVERLTGVRIFDAHMLDCANEVHPSFFDCTREYEMVIFRGLSSEVRPEPEPDTRKITNPKAVRAPINTQPHRIRTTPVTFFVFDRVLITVRTEQGSSVASVRARLMGNTGRTPANPEELTHRILNAMVDRYLELRAPLTDRLDRWQRNLLDPRRPFNDWHALLEQRIEIRKLEHLCEEQRDAIQEWRDHRLDELSDAMSVRVNDLLEHIARVLGHAQRLEQTAESAVQLHFSATAHRTNEIMRTLTILTAIFMPLTLITGIFGMNFEVMPLIKSAPGFWWVLGGMLGIASCLLLFFRYKRFTSAGLTRRADPAPSPDEKA